jgi:O-antigen/teichoic acid export membrane protein
MSTPNRRLALGALAMFGLTVIQRGFGLLAVTVLARLLEPRGLGAYNFALNSSQTFQGLTRLGIDAGLHVELAGLAPSTDQKRAEQALGEAFGLTLCLTVLAAIIMLSLADLISARLFAAPGLAPFMRIGVLVMMGQCIAQICYVGFAGLNAFARYSKVSMAGGLLSLALVLTGALAGGAYGGAAGFALAQAMVAALLFWQLRRECAGRGIALNLRWPRNEALRLLRLGLPFYLGVLWMIPVEFYALGLISRTSGVEQLGQLRVIQALMGIVGVLPNALAGPLVTYLSERHAAGHGETALMLQIRVIWVGALLLALMLATIFPLGILVIFGPHFALASRIGVLAIVPFVATMLLNVLQGALLARRKTLALFWIGALMAGVQLSLAVVLIPSHGLVGFFVAQSMAYGVGAVATGLWLYWMGALGGGLGGLVSLFVGTMLTIAALAADASIELESFIRAGAFSGLFIMVFALCWFGTFSEDERNRLAAYARMSLGRVAARFSMRGRAD